MPLSREHLLPTPTSSAIPPAQTQVQASQCLPHPWQTRQDATSSLGIPSKVDTHRGRYVALAETVMSSDPCVPLEISDYPPDFLLSRDVWLGSPGDEGWKKAFPDHVDPAARYARSLHIKCLEPFVTTAAHDSGFIWSFSNIVRLRVLSSKINSCFIPPRPSFKLFISSLCPFCPW